MENKYNILNEIEKVSPKLSQIRKENKFSVPVDYFDDFQTKIFDRINKNNQKNSKKFNLSYLFQQPQYTIAASLIIVLIISSIYIYKNKTIQTAKNDCIYWDEVFNDNTILDKVDEAMLVDSYIDESHNQTNILDDEIINLTEREYKNDIFNEL